MRNKGWVHCPDCDAWVATPGEDQIATPLFVATCHHCGSEFDWRSFKWDWSRRFLVGACFRWEEYVAPREDPTYIWSHEHCAMCRQTFMELDHPSIQRFGYVANANGQEWWVCRTCFDDFQEEFNWRVEPPD
ncbi:hypothetical protein [Paludisphaera mucosa]|uniref:CULT domain-containing protein n=1 Tax=Paludisphaera mucosa TaxID=3030827 RepID=A0ABT6F4K9_9BACT|nr:hypothetical protein [Paludisphaera mucosa]MDG3002335.1 hypothetical protein [Paludisphaera mucosa]